MTLSDLIILRLNVKDYTAALVRCSEAESTVSEKPYRVSEKKKKMGYITDGNVAARPPLLSRPSVHTKHDTVLLFLFFFFFLRGHKTVIKKKRRLHLTLLLFLPNSV